MAVLNEEEMLHEAHPFIFLGKEISTMVFLHCINEWSHDIVDMGESSRLMNVVLH